MAQTPKPLYPADVDGILETLRAQLIEELRPIVRAELIAELAAGGARPQAAKAKAKLKSKAEPSLPSPKAAALKVKPGERRSGEAIENAARVLEIWLRAHPGSRIDQAALNLEVPVKDLQLPVKYLLKAKRITKKGKLRGTTYTVKG